MSWGERRAEKKQAKQEGRQAKADEFRRAWDEAGIVFAVEGVADKNKYA